MEPDMMGFFYQSLRSVVNQSKVTYTPLCDYAGTTWQTTSSRLSRSGYAQLFRRQFVVSVEGFVASYHRFSSLRTSERLEL